MDQIRYCVMNKDGTTVWTTMPPWEPPHSGSKKLDQMLQSGQKVSLEEMIDLLLEEQEAKP